MQYNLKDKKPAIHPTSFVAPSADLIGSVTLEADTSVWYQAVLRADNEEIRIGEGSNVQDGVVIHVDPGFPCIIGKNCVVGHRAVLHGCTLADNVLVGIGAIVLNGAHVPHDCLIGAGALVAEGKQLEPGHLYLGVPARKVRPLSDPEKKKIRANAEGYQERARRYSEELEPVTDRQ
jgi:carbonic anhydrase/acetyltransferase-like protein (isoleucine patch superfamily)